MRKYISLILVLVCVLGLVGCNNRSMNYIIENEPNITGIVEEVRDSSILIYIQTDGYPYGAYCDVSLNVENKDSMTHFNIGDEVVVYYNGDIAESDPLQINTVYAITLKTPASQDPSADLNAVINELWPGTITNIFTEGGADSVEVVELEVKGYDPIHFTLLEDTEYLRYHRETGETVEITKEDLYVGAWVEIDCEKHPDSGYRPILTITVFEGEEKTGKLTLETVMELSAKGEELTWSDFEQYESIDTGSGLFILVYDIDNNFDLMIGGGSLQAPPMYIRLVSKVNRDNYIDIRTENVMEFLENRAALKEPPTLTVVCGEESVEALRGTTSWMYDNGDGTSTGIESDSLHPLQAKEYMTPLNLMPSYLSHIDPFAANLQWNVVPDKVSVRCWSEDSWGQYDAESEDIPVKVFAVDSTAVGYAANFTIELKDGNYIYEVTAEWNRSEKYGGTAYYSFYTVEPDMELQPIEETDDLCGYPLAPTE